MHSINNHGYFNKNKYYKCYQHQYIVIPLVSLNANLDFHGNKYEAQNHVACSIYIMIYILVLNFI